MHNVVQVASKRGRWVICELVSKHIILKNSLCFGFFCVDFVTSTKTNLEMKIDLPVSFWRDTFSDPKRKRGMACTLIIFQPPFV